MTLRLRNTLTRTVDEVVPLEPGRIRMYTCGPTVYRYAHIGNLRSYLLADLIRRALLARGVDVFQVKNITDVGHLRDDQFDRGEDKMLVQARLEDKSPEEIARFYEATFHEDERAANILPAHLFPRATDHIGEMVAMTERLVDAGFAYGTEGNVYFSVVAFPGYGKLSGNTLDELRAGHRGEVEPDKRDPADFALWKHAGERRLMRWPTARWGAGYPGWHIECSAMATKYLGEQFDIHTGGIDNVFPHHEDEIAQSEGALGHRVVGIWMHGEFLTMADAKMAKSTGNSIRVADLPDMGYEPLAFRYLALTAHYRSKLDFSADALHAAASGLARLRRAVAAASPEPVDLAAEPMASYRARFTDAVADDLGTPRALAVAQAVSSADDLTDAQRRSLLLDFDRVLGLSLDVPVADAPLPAGAEELLARRAGARAARDWALSDALRDELAALGVDVRDTAAGQETTVRG